jgi:hypothetical protein
MRQTLIVPELAEQLVCEQNVAQLRLLVSIDWQITLIQVDIIPVDLARFM